MMRTEEGFSLIELMTVLLVIAILLATAIPVYLGARERSQDRAAQAMLINALKVEETIAVDNAGYTDVAATLEAAEPVLDWSGIGDRSVHVVVGTTLTTNDTVLLYTKSASGSWHGVKRIAQGPTTGVYTCTGVAEGDVDGLADCVGNEW